MADRHKCSSEGSLNQFNGITAFRSRGAREIMLWSEKKNPSLHLPLLLRVRQSIFVLLTSLIGSLIQQATTLRNSIGQVLWFCLDHSLRGSIDCHTATRTWVCHGRCARGSSRAALPGVFCTRCYLGWSSVRLHLPLLGMFLKYINPSVSTMRTYVGCSLCGSAQSVLHVPLPELF